MSEPFRASAIIALSSELALKIAPISGLNRLSTIEVTTAVNAAPMTTATARSITFPRRMNSLKPLSKTEPFEGEVPGQAAEPERGRRARRAGGARGTRGRGRAGRRRRRRARRCRRRRRVGLRRTGRRRPRRRRARRLRPAARVRPVEPGPVERHADRTEHLAERSAAVRAHREGVVGEGLLDVEGMAAVAARVRVGGHSSSAAFRC